MDVDASVSVSIVCKENHQYLARSCVKFGQYCLHRLLELRPDENSNAAIKHSSAEEIGLAESAIHAVFRAMQFEDQDAINLIPQLVDVATRYVHVAPLFMQLSQATPAWFFLRWLPQLLAQLSHSTRADLVINTLERITSEYPQAVFYPLQLTHEDLEGKKEALPYLQRIHAKLSGSEHLYVFCESLDQLNYSQLKMRDLNRFVSDLHSSTHMSDAEKTALCIQHVAEFIRKVHVFNFDFSRSS
jgi:hypothetical protein